MKLIKKVSIVLVCLMVFSFCMPNISRASLGGKLMNPIMSLICSLGDSIMSVVQSMTIDFNDTIIDVDTEHINESFGEWCSRHWTEIVAVGTIVVGVVCTLIPLGITQGIRG